MGDPHGRVGFIAAPFPLEPETAAPHVRRSFTVHRAPDRATLHATALGIVEPHQNGTRVGDEVLAPGRTSYRHRVPVSAHDATGLIQHGTNVLGAVLGEGWAAGRLGWSAGGKADRHFPDIPFTQVARRLRDEPMRTVLDRIPDTAGGARSDLAAALGRR